MKKKRRNIRNNQALRKPLHLEKKMYPQSRKVFLLDPLKRRQLLP